jgi:hypothetical protein
MDVQGYTYGRGALVVSDVARLRTREHVERIARDLGLRATAVRGPLPPGVTRLARARIGLYRPWVETIDEGWTRWLLERHEFPFETLSDADIRRSGLRERLDAIIVPDQSLERLMNGHAAGAMPAEYTGGLGSAGALALRQFVEDGGTLVTLDSASALAMTALGLPVVDVAREAGPDRLFVPGSIVRVTLDEDHPLAFGMPPDTAGFFAFSSVFDLAPAAPPAGEAAVAPPAARIVGRYGSSNALLSGWLEGEHLMAGRGAVIEAHAGQGRAVLLGFRVQHRAQSHATFRLLFNALHTAARRLPPSRSGTR